MVESSLTEQERVVAEAATPGGQLRNAREQAQLTLAVVANELKLTTAYIEALEDDRFESLPAEPFVLGYLRAYARFLTLDAQQLVDSYHEYRSATAATAGHLGTRHALKAPPVTTTEPSRNATGPAERTKRREAEPEVSTTRYGWIIVVVALLLWVLASVLMPETSTPAVSAPAAEQTLDTEIETQDSMDDLNQDTDTVVEAAPEATRSDSNPGVVQPVAIVDETATESGHLAGLDTLQLDFINECWLEVTDSRGDVLNADLYQLGDSITLHGKAPFNVMLGNVRAVTARLNDETLQLNPDGFRKTLRLRIASVSDIEVLSSSQPERED